MSLIDYGRPELEARFRLDAVIGCTLVLLIFVVSWSLPFRVEGDVAYVAKAAQQYVYQGVPFNQLRLVDPLDLSRDVDTWIFWWPPFIYTSFVVLLSLGLTIGSAAQFIMLAAAIVGTLAGRRYRRRFSRADWPCGFRPCPRFCMSWTAECSINSLLAIRLCSRPFRGCLFSPCAYITIPCIGRASAIFSCSVLHVGLYTGSNSPHFSAQWPCCCRWALSC